MWRALLTTYGFKNTWSSIVRIVAVIWVFARDVAVFLNATFFRFFCYDPCAAENVSGGIIGGSSFR
jgi:hypothetical protein